MRLSNKNSVVFECPRCGQNALAYKIVALKYKGSDLKAFHYKVRCPKCKNFCVKRNKEMFDLLKKVEWVYSSSVLKNEALKNGLFD